MGNTLTSAASPSPQPHEATIGVCQAGQPSEQLGLHLVVLGTGAGATCVYSRQCSSSFVVMRGDEPLLLCDLGYGVAASCTEHVGSIPRHVYVSHNHGDHSGELPVVLAVESRGARGPLALLAHYEVMGRLREHRLAELASTGKPLEAFAHFQVAPCGALSPVGDTGLFVRPCRSRHSETCYGFVLYDSARQPLLGWTADSGPDPELYEALAEAPLLLLDARATGSAEHAGFDDIAQLVSSPALNGKAVYVTGYGRQDEAPRPEEVPGTVVCRPGMRIPLNPPSAA